MKVTMEYCANCRCLEVGAIRAIGCAQLACNDDYPNRVPFTVQVAHPKMPASRYGS